MSNVRENVVANTHAKKAQQLPASTQFAIVQALPNIVNGAFWGFTTLADVKNHEEAFRVDKNITARRLGNACLIEVNPDYLIKAVAYVDASLITKRDIDNMQKGIADGQVSFDKFLGNKAKKGFAGLVGIYCVNDSTAMTYKGVSYPAFRVSIKAFLELCNKHGYSVRVGGTYVSAQQAKQAGQKLFDSMILSPTNTGIFVDVRTNA